MSKGFGAAWTLYAEKRGLLPYSLPDFLDWISPLTASDIRGKAILDMGCGLGSMAANINWLRP